MEKTKKLSSKDIKTNRQFQKRKKQVVKQPDSGANLEQSLRTL